MQKRKTIILGVTASIAIYKACHIVRSLREEGYVVQVVMTEDAQKLMSPVVFASLSGNKVHTQMFAVPEEWSIKHVSLAQSANLVLIVPATANIIGKIASGICDDLLTCVVCATKAKVMFAPAMNEFMYSNAITQGNIEKLKKLGYVFVGPKKGRLACGVVGTGCLADVDMIVKAAKQIL